MLINLSANYPALWKMVTGLAYVAGLGFIMRAVYQLKTYGQNMSMMSSQGNLKGPLISFIVGAALIFLPTIKASLIASSFGGAQTPISYASANSLWNAQSTYALLGLVQFVGVVAFIRGWFHLSHLGGQSGGQHSFGKALTHIIGGILAINIQGTINMLQTTFGIGT